MIQLTSDTILGVFLIFCRVGGCLMVAPGLSSSRIPLQVRLFIALAVSLAVSPVIIEKLQAGVANQAPAMLLQWILMEVLTGLLIGFLGRVYFMALQTLLSASAMALGLSGISGAAIDDAEAQPALTSLIMMVATALLFVSDLHWELFRGVIASYSRIPLGQGVSSQLSLVQVTDQIGPAFVIALRISSPFILYSVAVNLAVSLANKLTPQIPVYFLATPFIMFGGLFVLHFAAQDYILLFMEAFSVWLRNG